MQQSGSVPAPRPLVKIVVGKVPAGGVLIKMPVAPPSGAFIKTIAGTMVPVKVTPALIAKAMATAQQVRPTTASPSQLVARPASTGPVKVPAPKQVIAAARTKVINDDDDDDVLFGNGKRNDCTPTPTVKRPPQKKPRKEPTPPPANEASDSNSSQDSTSSSSSDSEQDEDNMTIFKMAKVSGLVPTEYKEDESQAAPVEVKPARPPRMRFPNDLDGAIAKLEEQVQRQQATLRIKDDNKAVSLGTSKINYIDPRIISAWAQREGVPLSKIFSATIIKKFPWAVNANTDFRF